MGSYFIYDQFATIDERDTAFRFIALVLCFAGYFTREIRVHFTILICGILAALAYIFWSYNMAEVIQPFDSQYSKAEHLTIFLTFLYAFVVAEFFQGWAIMFKKHGRSHLSITHFLWTLFTFFLLIDIWWGNWVQQEFIAKNLINFLIVLATPFWFYLLTVFLFPKGPVGGISYRDLFYKNRQLYLFNFRHLLCDQHNDIDLTGKISG